MKQLATLATTVQGCGDDQTGPTTFSQTPRGKSPLTATEEYWKKVPLWENTTKQDFLSYRWQVANTIERKEKLLSFLERVIPAKLSASATDNPRLAQIQTREDFLADVVDGMRIAPMSVRLTPHVLSVADWTNPLTDPICRQFVPLRSNLAPDHPKLTLDSLHETDDSPVPGLVHRYPEKVLFLGKSNIALI